jgi:SAM-dependent methyltransferase
MQQKEKYIHYEFSEDMVSPNEIAPVVYHLIKPKTVVDFGCGVGTFLRAFKDLGAEEILGLDGPWLSIDQLSKYIDRTTFKETDLEAPVSLSKKYDLAICLEVAEHLKELAADILINTLVRASDVILFSAAVPGQGGQNHINEQWKFYWEAKFNNHGYYFHDVLRPIFWDNKNIAWWYKQNMFLVVRNNVVIDWNDPVLQAKSNIIDKCIHPEVLATKAAEIDRIIQGELPVKQYWQLFWNAFFKKLKGKMGKS